VAFIKGVWSGGHDFALQLRKVREKQRVKKSRGAKKAFNCEPATKIHGREERGHGREVPTQRPIKAEKRTGGIVFSKR